MKKPNGFGTVYKLSGNRRRPWRATITIGYDEEDGRQLRLTIGYYETRKEAEKALASYEYNPLRIEIEKLTVKDIYERWSKEHFNNIAHGTSISYQTAYTYITPILNIPFIQLKPIQLQKLFDDMNLAPATKGIAKILINMLYKYALKYEIVDKDYSELINIGKREKVIVREVFTNDEILKLWKYKDLEWVDTILIMIYTGMRIGELLSLENNNIDLESRILKNFGIKTKAGKNRVIPISYKILPLIKNRLSPQNKYLISDKNGLPITYPSYRHHFTKVIKKLNLKHTIHDCRHTFITLLSNTDANSTTITKLAGHTDIKTSENIYIHKNIDELKKAIDLI